MYKRKHRHSRFLALLLILIVAAIALPAAPAIADDGGGNSSNQILDNHDRVDPAQRQAAADRFWAMYNAAPGNEQPGAQPGMGVDALLTTPLNPYGVPHYFGPYANWAYSPLPTGAITGIALTSGGTGYSAPTVSIVDLYGHGTGATATPTVGGGVITNIALTSGGSGYVAPAVVITDAAGTGAAASATISLGGISGVTLVSGGSGYTAPVVSITGTGTGATAAATLANGVITGIAVNSGGSGYTAPAVNITGSGSGAIASATLANGVITAVNITNGGSGYTAPVINITGNGTGAAAAAIVTNGIVTALNLTNGGSGYTAPAVTFTGDGTGAAATASINPTTGAITNITLTSGGSGYTTVTVGFTDATGTGATATATLTNGIITGATMVSGGSGYTTASVGITGATGTGATATATISNGIISSVNVINGGSGYATANVGFSDPTGTGATATAAITNGIITGITIINAGINYTTAAIAITDPTGTGASATIATGAGGIRKFLDSLPGLTPAGINNLGQYIPLAVADTSTYTTPASDYYEIALVEFTEKMHTDLPPTRMRGYVQLSTAVVPGAHVALINPNGTPILLPNGSQAYGVDYPHYLGPTIVAQRDRPVRVKFYNLLPIGAGGDLFLPVDTTVMGAGAGPVMDMVTGQPISYTENRATIHLHGNDTVWISDGTPHQWITPANETTPYPKGVSVADVPDMPSPGPGAMTFFYTNQDSARLMFYHDHAFGITRLNVYGGEAAGYVLTDQVEQDLINGTNNSGVNPGLAQILPDIGIPLIIQDKSWVDANTIANTDPTWGWALDAQNNPVTGSLWYPHVYMPAQNPWDPTGTNAFGRWHYGPWFWPPTLNIADPPVPNPYYDPINAPWEPPMMPGTPNPSAVGEAFMDTPLVNGTAYPYLEVQPRTYRFRILSAANDRFFNLQWYIADPAVTTWDGRTNTEVKMVPASPTPGFPADWPTDGREGGVPDPAMRGPDWIQIGTEGGFLPAPVIVPNQPVGYNQNVTSFNFGNVDRHSLLLGSAERADVLVDFSAYAGKTLILYNDAPAAFPALVPQYDYYTGDPDRMDSGGAPSTQPGYGPNVRTVMQVRVAGTTNTQQTSVVTTAPTIVSPGDAVNITAAVYQSPSQVKVQTANLPVTFNYVIFNLDSGTQLTGSTVINTNAAGDATLSLVAPMERAVILVDTVFFDSGTLMASSNMNLISVLPIIQARISATSILGSIIFKLTDQYGIPMPNQTLTFQTTAGALNVASGVTNINGEIAVNLTGGPAVVSASFGGYISPLGWSYQPTMERTVVETTLSTNIQTRTEATSSAVVSPGDPVTITASIFQLPWNTKVQSAGLSFTFNYVIFNLQSGTQVPGTSVAVTDALGNAVFSIAAPNETALILVDSIFTGSGAFQVSSTMRIISVIPIVETKLTATANLGNITFHLATTTGSPLSGQTLTFLTTQGTLSAASGVTNVNGDVSVTLSNAISGVVSASFGGQISPQGWAYQPTMARVKVNASIAAVAPPYNVAALNAVFAKTGAKRGVFEVSQDPPVIPQAAYNSAYNTSFPADPVSQYIQNADTSKTFIPVGSVTPVSIPLQPKSAHDEMGAVYDEFGRMSTMIGLEMPTPGANNQQFLMYGYESPPVDVLRGSVSGTQIGSLGDGTQIWKITHNGVDTHTIHFHLFNVQIINRIAWDGINLPPDATELGWKDTIRMNPLEHIIVAMRPMLPTLPFNVPNSIRLINPAMPEGALLQPPPSGEFTDPLGEPVGPILNHYINLGWEYVWHCHILAHEEMDMMHATSFGVPPAAPSNLTRNVLSGPARVALSWQDNSINETDWLIQRASLAAGPWTTIATVTSTTGAVTGGTITYTDTTVAAATTYFYRVVAANVVGDTTIYPAPSIGFPTISVESTPSGTVNAQIP